MRLLHRLLDLALPPRLGGDFRWLIGSAFVNNAADGVAIAAGPLLVASLTHDPFLVSLALVSEYLPVILFGLFSGTIADRVDRKTMVVTVNLVRAFVLGVLVWTIATGTVSIVLVLATLFTLATAENFADSASSTLLPSLVAKADLGIANARVNTAFVLLNQLLLPPVGAFLFSIGPSLPFVANLAGFVLGAVLISRIRASTRPERGGEQRSIRADMAEGIRWLMGHPPMRTLALTIVTFNITYGAAWGVLVLYASQRLGMDAVGFGLLTTASAIGGVIATLSYGALERRFSAANLMRTGLTIEALTHLSLALTTSPIWALGTFVVFGAYTMVWGTISTTIRQRAVPNELLGRVGGVYRVALIGGLVIGTPIGGLLARQFGITAPFWFGFIGSAVLVVLLWRELANVAHAGEAEPAEALPGEV